MRVDRAVASEPDRPDPYAVLPGIEPSRRVRRWSTLGAAVVVTVALTGVVLYGSWMWWYLQKVNPAGDPGAAEVFEVVETDDLETLSRRLEQRGFIVDDGVFRRYVRDEGGLAPVAGFYTLRPRDHMGNLLRVLRTPPNETFFDVTFPEGFTVDQMATRLSTEIPGFDAELFLERVGMGSEPSTVSSVIAPDAVNLEGLLFPDTYQIAGDETPAQVAQRMASLMERVGRQEDIEAAAGRLGRTQYEILIVASMIEREAKTAVDRPKIARVIYNRLELGMPLEIDATLYYGRDPDTPFAELKAIQSPYNTYLSMGLPPTPIANPGRASIEAAVAPAPDPPSGDPICLELPAGEPCRYLYYVLSDQRGNHAFAATIAQHEANVERARAAGLLG